MNESPIARVLVVDDEAPLVTALRDTLRQHGYDVVGMTTPAEALAVLRRERFELLLTDLNLPQMNGIAFLREALVIDPGMIAIMMTGQGTIDSAVEAMKAGALDYILKPFKLGLVLPVLARALAVRGLRRENEKLQLRLRARTSELEATNQELEAFSYSVSHDLRGPLRTVEGFIDIVIEELPAGNVDELRGHARRIRDAAQRMNGLIEDLLRLARTARAEVRREPVDLTAYARETAAKLQSETPGRTVEWTVAEDLRALGDPGLMRVAVENLLSNAWKYTSKASQARIEVGLEQSAEGAPVFFVRDNGVGFEMQFAQKIFAPFQRLHAESDFPGVGVGLATVQRIIHKHGGRIWAEAEPGKGAKFCFTVPAAV